MIDKILMEVVKSDWQPSFEFTTNINDVVDSILIPHEDYGLGLHSELLKILEEESLVSDEGADLLIDFNKACEYQKRLFDHKLSLINDSKWLSLPNLYIDLGMRNTHVKVGKWTPPAPYLLPNLIGMCFPVVIGANILEDLTQWYKVFQIIHPFNDLNGRVGGLIINIVSYQLTGKYLIDKEYYK